MGNELQIAVLWPLSCLLPSSWAQKPCAEITIPDEVKCRAALHQNTHSCFELLRLWAERTAVSTGEVGAVRPSERPFPLLDPLHANGGLGRRESQGSVSSAGSLDLPEACRTLGPERDKATKHCSIQLPDGTSCMVPVRAGLSIKEVLSGLCERQGINGAAVDLFLVGGDKPLVLHQDSSILESRDLRLEKRTLFRLDLVPINRSVGLKAKPSKPVTEVLRPVAAKYGLRLSELVARLNGEKEPLDLGAPISSLDGQRVILEEKDPSRGKEFFELISKAQSNRADDQRGLLRKEDLVLPEFLRLPPSPTELTPSLASAKAFGQRPTTGHGKERAPRPREPQGPAWDCRESPATSPGSADSAPFCAPGTPSPPAQEAEARDVQTVEGEHVADLTLTGEGDINSPNSTFLPPPPAPRNSAGPPRPGGGARSSRGPQVNSIIDVDHVTGSASGLGSSIPGVRTGPRRSRASRASASDHPGLSPVRGGPAKPKASPHHATFV
ncbi:Regulator of G-protein signaling 12 [Camelus dromedarius]|uniref:Regulator of G-protein signaling 12 n=1 Tax=Camelus dromedarius TaxID=9838 RepID=A0A5N4EG44_CAMDR|nr:Regulator of G-protein signaling 12 [Camelus dromedarius]